MYLSSHDGLNYQRNEYITDFYFYVAQIISWGNLLFPCLLYTQLKKWEFCGRSQSTMVLNEFWRSTHFFFELSFSRLICDDYLHLLLVDLSFNSKVTFELFISIDKYLSYGHLYQAQCNCQKTLQNHISAGADP